MDELKFEIPDIAQMSVEKIAAFLVSCFKSDSAKIFKTISPNTTVKVV